MDRHLEGMDQSRWDNRLTILIVDDEELGRTSLESICCELSDDFRIVSAAHLNEAFTVLSSQRVHVVLLDKHVGPDTDDLTQNGIEAITEMLKLQPYLQILMVTGSKEIQDAVLATQYGAFGYVTKDLSPVLIRNQIQKATQMAALLIEKEEKSRDQSKSLDKLFVQGVSPAMKKLRAQVSDVSQTERPILLLGETGTGKTTLAKLIHENRKKFLKQRERPFIGVNIAALSPQLIEGELFGSERGSFTGSVTTKQGLLELANSGTLFLDEIGEISLDIQKKLLTVLESGVFRRVGGTKELKSHFGLICATNRNLEKMVAEGTFREDLFLRLSTFPIVIPPLKERPEDIPALIEAILPRCSKDNGVSISFSEIPHDYLEWLKRNVPPGNIRGIEQNLSRLFVHAPRDRAGNILLKKWKLVFNPTPLVHKPHRALTPADILSQPINFISDDFPGLGRFLRQFEERILREVSLHFPSNRDAAKFLKLSESTTSVKLRGVNS